MKTGLINVLKVWVYWAYVFLDGSASYLSEWLFNKWNGSNLIILFI